MAEEENIEELQDAQKDFYERFMKAYAEFDEYFGCPHLTCGEYTWEEVRKPFSNDVAAAGAAVASEYDTFQFFASFKEKFAKEIEAYNDLKERVGSAAMADLREQYMNEQGFKPDHPARMYNPFWKFDE